MRVPGLSNHWKIELGYLVLCLAWGIAEDDERLDYEWAIL